MITVYALVVVANFWLGGLLPAGLMGVVFIGHGWLNAQCLDGVEDVGKE